MTGWQKETTHSNNTQCMVDPIGLVNLAYMYADNYYPTAGYQLVRTIIEDLDEGIFNFFSFVREAHDINTFQIKDLFALLEQLMKENDDPKNGILGGDLGRNMLRKTAAILVQSRLHGRLPVSDDFGALAMDPSIEGFGDEELEKILIACGNIPLHYYYGKRKACFRTAARNYAVGPRRIRRLLKIMGRETLYRRKNLTKLGLKKFIKPYLLSGLVISSSNRSGYRVQAKTRAP